MKYHNAMSIQRFLAFFIDYLIIYFITSLIITFIPAYGMYSNQLMELLKNVNMDLEWSVKALEASVMCLVIQSLVYIPLIILYQIVLPMFWKHQTLGRLVAGVRVMRLNKDVKPGLGSLIVRELIGGYIFNTLFIQSFVLPVLNYLFSRNRGRSLADMISKTRLIDYKLAQMQGVIDEEIIEDDYINADFKEVDKKEDVETDYKVF